MSSLLGQVGHSISPASETTKVWLIWIIWSMVVIYPVACAKQVDLRIAQCRVCALQSYSIVVILLIHVHDLSCLYVNGISVFVCCGTCAGRAAKLPLNEVHRTW